MQEYISMISIAL